MEKDTEIMEAAGKAGSKGKGKLSIERIYQKKTQLEHILLRPDTYIGSVEPVTQSMWVFDESGCMVNREITFVPGLYKIFDEILVNAADNKQRDKNMNSIKIDIDPESNEISIWNNGKGIPVVEHQVEKTYVPSLIFGHLLTSSNYNDDEKKVTGGRNGYGAKLCNIFSTKFTVETACKEYKKIFKQSWQDNMKEKTVPRIEPFNGEDFTKISFKPDLSKFKMEKLDDDIVALMSRRAYDVAGSTRGVKVYLNGTRLQIKGFKDYVELYVKGKEDEQGNQIKVVYESTNDRWEVAVATSDTGFQQMSFVNSIATTKGGRHVDYVTDQIVTKLADAVKKKNKAGVNIRPFQIKNHLWVFVNCQIENPTFDSQTKENMTLQVKSFGSRCHPSDKFYTQVLKCGVLESIMTWVRFKAQTQLSQKCSSKKHSKLKGIPKLEDANDAGTKNSIDCTLILTEGDSAKSLAVSGLGVVGRDKFGVFPLRGKMLNVREATHKQILENAEINNVIKIMGLQYKKSYDSIDDLKTLRYGRLMIMTDQDQDGSHIKGLLINFIHHNWPSLLKLPFLEEFITPIVKATKGKEEKSFYSLPEFEEWKTSDSSWPTWKIKYYKGLGTSTAKEAKEYFANMMRHRIKFKYQGPEDDRAIQLAFSKKAVDQRKEWLSLGMEERKQRKELGLPELYLYGKETTSVTYQDFVNKELILFSNMDNERSLPSLVDGLKPGQRKVIFTCFKRNDKREIKVAQLAGSVAEHSAYHHGEVSLMATIINLAQNFVGSNNINLLQPIGQFGTRLQGGKDAASPRYIFTMLSPLARLLIPAVDDPLLNHLFDDNLKIEPEFYIPVIPMVLVNGADGIGTGWSTKIPNYNPREIVANIRRMIVGDEPLSMKPWFKNFRGTIDLLDTQRFLCNGEISILGPNKLEITELPVKTWTQQYKESVLEVMLHGTDKIPPQITDYKEYHTDTTVRFVVTMAEDKLAKAEEQGLHKVFKLQTQFSTSSMVLFDHNGCIKKYDSPEEILREFFNVRLEAYVKRKAYMVGILSAEAKKLENQARFILEKIEGKIVIENKRKREMIMTLVERGYDSDPVKAWKEQQAKQDDDDAMFSDSDDEANERGGPDFDYLLGMTLWSLTRERKDDLINKRNAKQAELDNLRQKSPENLWEDDLNAFLEELNKVEQKEREDEESGIIGKPIKFGKTTAKGRSVKSGIVETKPSPMGQRVVPRIDSELKKKVDKPGGASGKKGKVKKEDNVDDEDELLPLSERLGTSPEKYEMKKEKSKKPTTTTKQSSVTADTSKKEKKPRKTPVKKGPKRNPWSDSESNVSISEASEVDDKDFPIIPPERRESSRRSAASKAKYTFDSEEEKEEEVFDRNDDIVDEGGDDDAAPQPAHTSNSKKYESGSESEKDFGFSENTPTKVNGEKPKTFSDSDDSIAGISSSLPIPKPKASDVSGNRDSLFDTLFGNRDSKSSGLKIDKPTFSHSDDSDKDSDNPSLKLTIPSTAKDSSEDSDNDFFSKSSLSTKTVPSKDVKVSSSSDSGPDDSFPLKTTPKKTVKRKKKTADSDVSEDEFKPQTTKKQVRKKSAGGSTGGGGRKKKKVASGSDSDTTPKVKSKKAKKKAGSDSDNDDIGIPEDFPMEARTSSGRARAPIKYNFGASSDDEEF